MADVTIHTIRLDLESMEPNPVNSQLQPTIFPLSYIERRALEKQQCPAQVLQKLVDTFKLKSDWDLGIYSKSAAYLNIDRKESEQLTRLLKDHPYRIANPKVLRGVVGGIILMAADPSLRAAMNLLQSLS